MADPPPLRTGSSARALFGHTDYRHFWISRFMDLLGVQIQAVTLAWHVYALARDQGQAWARRPSRSA